MTEVYLVGVGAYYEFGIDKVFSNKEEAEEYAKLLNNKDESNEARVMEYEITENLKYETCNWLKIKTSKVIGKDDYKFNMDIVKVIDSPDDIEHSFEFNESLIYANNYVTEGYFMGGRKHQKITIILKRKLESDFDANDIEEKFKAITQDILSIIEQNPAMDAKEIGKLEYELSEID